MACGGHHAGDLRVSSAAGNQRASFHRQRHARAFRACDADRGRGARREQRRDDAVERRRADADARDIARDPRLESPSSGRVWGTGRRHRHHAVAQSAQCGGIQVQPADRRPGRFGSDRMDREASERTVVGGSRRCATDAARTRSACVDDETSRLPIQLRRRSRCSDRLRSDPRCRTRDRCRSARRRRRPLLARDRREIQDQPDGGEPRYRPYVPLHDARLGWQDPHGSVVALCDEEPDRSQGSIRYRFRVRYRSRSSRYRCAQHGIASGQPLPRGNDRLPVPSSRPLARRRGSRKDGRQ